MQAPEFRDRVKDTTTTTGTGNITLSGTAPTGFQSFNTAFGTGVYFQYVIEAGSEWEVGLGHLSASTTLVRDDVIASSNSNAAVSFSVGTKTVRCTIAAAAMKQDVLARVATVTILADDNSTAQNLFTVPTGKRFIFDHIILRDESTDISAADFSAGIDITYGSTFLVSSFAPAPGGGMFDGSKTRALKLHPPISTDGWIDYFIGVAADILKIKMKNTGLAGTETLECDVWGCLYDA